MLMGEWARPRDIGDGYAAIPPKETEDGVKDDLAVYVFCAALA